MTKYVVSWTEEDWYRVEIEADSYDDALDKFHAGDYDRQQAILTESGILQEGVDVWEAING
jgi:hypothetical protein